MSHGRVPGVATLVERPVRETVMIHSEEEGDGALFLLDEAFALAGCDTGEAFGANDAAGDIRLTSDELATSESGGGPSSA